MAAVAKHRPVNQFLCSICLDVFIDPVTTPCGHNFCNACITQNWDVNATFTCPLCKEGFESRPQLKVNTLLREMVVQSKDEAHQKVSSSSSEQQAAKPGEVPCDVCTGTKQKALKSCLVCLASYCHTHLEPHQTSTRLRRHQLMEPEEKMEDRMCLKHHKLLDLFCKTDQTCVCSICSVLNHKNHELVPLREEYEEKKAKLWMMESEIQQMIQKRRLKIQEFQESVKKSKEAANKETAEGFQVFSALMEAAQVCLDELVKEIRDKQKTTEKQAEDLIRDLEQEISDLMKVEQLSQSEDHFYLLQNYSMLQRDSTKDWTEIRVHPASYEGSVVRAVAHLEETLGKRMKTIYEAELKKIQQYTVDVTLNPDSAHPNLVLSDDGKQVYCGDVRKNLPEKPERFTECVNVLGKQGFSSGRFYFEVQVKGKTGWDVGVASESTNRNGDVTLSPQDGFWAVWLRYGNEFKALTRPSVRLHLRSAPHKVGVFVDYEEGLVSFYDVDAAALIFSFTNCCFTDKLYPLFSPFLNDGHQNSAPLIICPVGQMI